MLPYTENKENNLITRKFSVDIDPVDLLWHRDLKNRKIKVLEGTGWKIQIDNQLPRDIDNVFVPKNIWHRVIKGERDLIIEIREWD